MTLLRKMGHPWCGECGRFRDCIACDNDAVVQVGDFGGLVWCFDCAADFGAEAVAEFLAAIRP